MSLTDKAYDDVQRELTELDHWENVLREQVTDYGIGGSTVLKDIDQTFKQIKFHLRKVRDWAVSAKEEQENAIQENEEAEEQETSVE